MKRWGRGRPAAEAAPGGLRPPSPACAGLPPAGALDDGNGVGGQTPIFHALTHFGGVNPEVAQLLIERGADLTIRARVPGHYERPGELLDVSAAEYAAIFPLRD